MMTRSRYLTATAGLFLAASLAGCSGSPGALTTEFPSATPTIVAVDLPIGFPDKQVPLVDGPILHVSHPGNVWAAWVGSADLAGDLQRATGLLTAAGFQNTNAGPAFADFHGADYEVRIVAVVDDTYGSTLAYTIAEKASK
ncbi:hypothetical protein BH11ACT4_BH11ACT4_23160 [soil metagenome]